MSKGLEALQRIKDGNGISYKDLMNCFDIIEKDLERLYELEKTTLTFSNVQQIMLELDKSKKALEIIKEKGLSANEIAFLKNGESWETYVETMKELYWSDECLDRVLKSQEEYDSLEEALL